MLDKLMATPPDPKNMTTILIIDEDRCVRLMLAELMRSAGHTALVAADGATAMREVASSRVDLIVADCGTPEAKTALRELVRALSEREPAADVPTVLLTSAAHMLKTSELAGLGVQLILAKPFSTRELLAGVAELLAASGAARREAA